jgi:CRP-like cAMP-binding protein
MDACIEAAGCHGAAACLAGTDVSFERGATVFVAGMPGRAWRIVAGLVRLDREGLDGPEFGGLARVGDVIGAETLIFGRYTYTAMALLPLTIEAWCHDAADECQHGLLLALARSERRMADVLALRGGRATTRIRRLFGFIATAMDGGTRPCIPMPRLRDIADITGLQVETVSRTITQLTEHGDIAPLAGRHVQLNYASE